MKIKDVSINDIKNKKIWLIKSSHEDDPLNWDIVEISRINSNDEVLHSAVLVEKGKAVYPFLVTKFYEDGGEVGEFFIYINNRWFYYDGSIKLGETEGEYLSYISTMDCHEYQQGSFDNRKYHYDRFDFYSKQIGNEKIVEFKEKIRSLITAKFLRMNIADQVKYIRDGIIETEKLQLSNVARHNKLVREMGECIDYIKSIKESHLYLRQLLDDQNKLVRGWMKYNLFDIYEDECLKIIKEVAKEDSLEGFGAKDFLKRLADNQN